MVKDQTPARADYLIRQCGVSVTWTDGLGAELKGAGASDQVIQAVRDVAPKGGTVTVINKPPPPPTPPKPPIGTKAGELRYGRKAT